MIFLVVWSFVLSDISSDEAEVYTKEVLGGIIWEKESWQKNKSIGGKRRRRSH